MSFDAHIYGNGMPEEFFILLLELLAGGKKIQFQTWPILVEHLICVCRHDVRQTARHLEQDHPQVQLGQQERPHAETKGVIRIS